MRSFGTLLLASHLMSTATCTFELKLVLLGNMTRGEELEQWHTTFYHTSSRFKAIYHCRSLVQYECTKYAIFPTKVRREEYPARRHTSLCAKYCRYRYMHNLSNTALLRSPDVNKAIEVKRARPQTTRGRRPMLRLISSIGGSFCYWQDLEPSITPPSTHRQGRVGYKIPHSRDDEGKNMSLEAILLDEADINDAGPEIVVSHLRPAG